MKKLQNGRSMIEMLGVLAIIGVLSIGGLAGYTMAMNRHRANTLIDNATKCATMVQTHGYGELGVPPAVIAENAITAENNVNCYQTNYLNIEQPGYDKLVTAAGLTTTSGGAVYAARVAHGDTYVFIEFTDTNGITGALASRTAAHNGDQKVFAYSVTKDRWGSGTSISTAISDISAS